MIFRAFPLILLGVFFHSPFAAADKVVTIFAASSTQSAIDKIVDACPKMAATKCRVSYSASSSIARQISAGAPADIFVSANQRWMNYLAESNLVERDSIHIVASNTLVVIAAADATVSIQDDTELLNWLKSDRIAMGDPAHVPAGIYAEQALRTLGMWRRIHTLTLSMPNVRSALAVVARGEAGAGIVYATDALISDRVKVVYQFDPATHDTIHYPAAQVRGRATDQVNRVFELLTGEFGRNAFQSAGFRPPPVS